MNNNKGHQNQRAVPYPNQQTYSQTFHDFSEFIRVVSVGSPDDQFGDVLWPEGGQNNRRVTAVTPAQHVITLIAQRLNRQAKGRGNRGK